MLSLEGKALDVVVLGDSTHILEQNERKVNDTKKPPDKCPGGHMIN